MLFDAIKSLLGAQRPGQPNARAGIPADEGEAARAVDPVHLAACVLLLDVAYADGNFSGDEREHLMATLARHFALTGESIALLIIMLLTTPLQAAGEEYGTRGLIMRAAGSEGDRRS